MKYAAWPGEHHRVLKGQLKEMVERPLDGTVQEFRDRVCLTISGEDEANREETVEVIQLTPRERISECVNHQKRQRFRGARRRSREGRPTRAFATAHSGADRRSASASDCGGDRRSGESTLLKNECTNAPLSKLSTCLFDKSWRDSSEP